MSLSAEAHEKDLSSVASLITKLQTASGSNISTKTALWEPHGSNFMSNVIAAVHKPKITTYNASVSWSGVKCIATGLWSSGNVFLGVTNAQGLGLLVHIKGKVNATATS